jgi:hypothetical protein
LRGCIIRLLHPAAQSAREDDSSRGHPVGALTGTSAPDLRSIPIVPISYDWDRAHPHVVTPGWTVFAASYSFLPTRTP